MKLTIVQTRLGTFNAYVLRDEGGRFLRSDGTFTSDESQARQFAEVGHASTVADEIEAERMNGTRVAGWDFPAEGVDCPRGHVVRVQGLSQKTDRAYWYATREAADAALASPGFLASHGDQRESGSVHAHAGGPARRAWLGSIATPARDAAPAPTGHIRLAWLALLGAVALVLAAPVAVADPPPAPDAGVEVPKKAKPRQPTHWERWPQGGPRGGAGDEPSPSTGEEKPG